jgi:glycosyltransferase involved in cell wall biosynthesis
VARPLRVAHIITGLGVGGAELMLARLVERLSSERIENSVIVLADRGVVGERIVRAGVPVFALGMRPARPSPRSLWRLVRLLRQIRPDVVQTWLYHADGVGLLAATLAGVPHVLWNIRCAELDPRDHPKATLTLLRLLAWCSRAPSSIVSNSVAGRQAHQALGYRPRRWVVIPNGFDPDVFTPQPGAGAALRRELQLDDDVRIIGMLGRFHVMKDQATFIDAAGEVARARERVHFVVAGRGVAESSLLRERAEAAGLGHRVHLLAERGDAPQFLAALDIAVSSSYGEAFPNVIGEAMACGTPCVVTDAGDSSTLVGETGIVVPARDAGALAAALILMLDLAPADFAALQRAARQRIVEHFSLASVVNQYEALYRELAAPAVATATQADE